MTTLEFADSLMEESGHQINACFDGLSSEDFEKKPVDQMMSPRETVEHLLEVIQAVKTEVAGGKHEWGTFTAPTLSHSDLIAMFSSGRAEIVALALENLDTKPHLAKDFVAAHEFYHVGQMVSIRSILDPTWNAYSIYRH
jgi:uncharacterized damage-inducible protein DinB